MREAVNLDDDHARLIGLRGGARRQQVRHEQAEERTAPIHAEDRRERRVDRGVDERADQRGQERIDLDARRDRGDDEEDEDLEDDHQDPGEHQRPGRDDREQQRPDEDVEEPHERDRDHGVEHADNGDAGQDERRGHEGDGRHEQRDDDPLRQRPPPATPVPQDPDLGAVQVEQVGHAGEPLGRDGASATTPLDGTEGSMIRRPKSTSIWDEFMRAESALQRWSEALPFNAAMSGVAPDPRGRV